MASLNTRQRSIKGGGDVDESMLLLLLLMLLLLLLVLLVSSLPLFSFRAVRLVGVGGKGPSSVSLVAARFGGSGVKGRVKLCLMQNSVPYALVNMMVSSSLFPWSR